LGFSSFALKTQKKLYLVGWKKWRAGMKSNGWIWVWAVAMAAAVPIGLWAKRVPPKPVEPVTGDGVTYSTAGDGVEEFVVAAEAESGKELWRMKIYTVPIKKELETDVQTIYITKLKLSGAALYVRDEAKKCYQLDVKTQKVETVSCSAMKAAKSTATAVNK
jgi:outer membrane protein assembly factor BamB